LKETSHCPFILPQKAWVEKQKIALLGCIARNCGSCVQKSAHLADGHNKVLP